MMYKALISFTGLVSMAKGDVREISDISLANDLIKARYIEEVKKDAPPKKVTEKKPRSPRSKGVKK